VTINSLNPK
jgi:hypothetical protein